ncbi:hypothetical protein MTBBW1_540028 [Desulfamplus magnetovallimortis]|uniref:Uncharacterized protein n=1 Tax=Desulfamplus magnetovallimortis TaxID=1246637 RepID=A0A1W1HHU8_9BACT|nr:hypothetical protein MTBBW1_540028 [Desulfamplus magnetovallimortis]
MIFFRISYMADFRHLRLDESSTSGCFKKVLNTSIMAFIRHLRYLIKLQNIYSGTSFAFMISSTNAINIHTKLWHQGSTIEFFGKTMFTVYMIFFLLY